ncbi:MAG: hypothetical protein Q9227_001043 [Pyrenula ochraceoflavens]
MKGTPDTSGANGRPKTAANFLESQGRNIHPIFDSPDNSSKQASATPQNEAFNQSIRLHAEQFLQVMEAYQASIDDSKTRLLDLRGKHTWDEVLQVPKDARTAYIAVGVSKLRKSGRFVSKNAEAAAARISEKREKVLKTLLRIPDVIFQAERNLENFPLDPLLHDKAAELYLASLTAIEGITRWLLRHTGLKQIRAIVLGPLYSRSFDEKIQLLDEALEALQERVTILRDGAIVNTEKMVSKVEKVGRGVDTTTRATLHHVQGLKSEMKDLNISTNRTNCTISSVTGDVKSISKSQKETNVKVEQLNDLQQAKEEAKRAMMVVLEETTKTAKWMKKKDRDIRRLKMQVDMLQRAAAALTPYDLLDILGVNAEIQLLDTQRILRASQLPELSISQSAQGIFEKEEFKNWQIIDDSMAIYVEGSPPWASFGRITSLSLISSAVIEHFQGKDPAVPINFFCGLHTSSKDSLRGPQGMMRSLISQVLRLYTVDLDFISTRHYREQLQSFHVHTLCDCFANIVKRLSMDTVLFCVIDGISHYDTREWTEDYRAVVNCLIDLTGDEQLEPIFKLLISSSSRSRYIRSILPSEYCLSLPDAEDDCRSGPTEREISMRARRPVRRRDGELLRSVGLRPVMSGEGTRSLLSESENESETGSDSRGE